MRRGRAPLAAGLTAATQKLTNLLKSAGHPKGGLFVWYGIHAEEIRKIKCGAEERRLPPA
jgi:hypothetical protein